jgi:hypothetical protein
MQSTILIGLCLALSAPASGTSLFNTGVSDGGTPLPSGAVDPHYTIVSSPDGSGPAALVVIDGQFPFPPWLPNSPDSRWIGPIADGRTAVGGPGGNWAYETTFDLSSVDLSTFELTGRLASDNTSKIFLNGVNTGTGAPGGIVCCYDHFTAFRITSGFVPGVNRLDFIVHNSDCGPECVNPTGLRVEYGLFPVVVPEPMTFICVIAGLLAMKVLRWRSNTAACKALTQTSSGIGRCVCNSALSDCTTGTGAAATGNSGKTLEMVGRGDQRGK